MRTDAKLAALSGTSNKTPLHDIVTTVRRAIPRKSDRRYDRPLRDLDGWSSQSEVAFFEEVVCGSRE